MNTFSKMAVVVVGLAGLTGVAVAQPKAEAKAPEPKAADAKAGGMPEMKPPAELAEMAKMTTGTWHCKGQGMDHTMKMSDLTGTMKFKLEMGGWWVHGSFESKMGKEPFSFESYTTVDPGSKKFKRVMVETGGGWSNGESAGLKDGKVDWELAAHSAMGDAMFRDHEDMTDAKAGVKLWGEFSMDKGKTWTKVYEMACKK